MTLRAQIRECMYIIFFEEDTNQRQDETIRPLNNHFSNCVLSIWSTAAQVLGTLEVPDILDIPGILDILDILGILGVPGILGGAIVPLAPHLLLLALLVVFELPKLSFSHNSFVPFSLRHL